MRKRSGSSAGRRSSTFRRRSDNLHFDEFGFAVTKRKEQKLHHRCHDYRSSSAVHCCSLFNVSNSSRSFPVDDDVRKGRFRNDR
ncbi:hypothetical protein F2P81_006820 [Scophthalmus maximus]|uniref:Uncharacterized protein n=1 Tax=Scophthalmus maximus TaxID=52904 RepID=A0A6A4TFG1_SCOMX|nr:hypothetical protein F2P81_006820 [Scophthalmus maximus]